MSETHEETVWTIEQIELALRMQVRLVLDGVVVAQAQSDIINDTRMRVSQALKDMAESRKLRIHEGDMELREIFRWILFPDRLLVDGRWNPSTNECKLVGGPQNGSIVERRFMVDGQYALSGWSETYRRWVYTYKTRKLNHD